MGSSVAAAAGGYLSGRGGGRGPLAQPQRVSRHAHPKPLEAIALTISDAVLCSEMGVHFSPCGRLLAACAPARSAMLQQQKCCLPCLLGVC